MFSEVFKREYITQTESKLTSKKSLTVWGEERCTISISFLTAEPSSTEYQ